MNLLSLYFAAKEVDWWSYYQDSVVTPFVLCIIS